MSHTINFAEIKQRISVVQGAKFLGLSLTNDGKTLRCKCPVCETDDPRSLSLLPDKNTFRCFKSEVYGSVIDLVAHVKGINPRQAAKWLDDQESNEWLDEYNDNAPEPEPQALQTVALPALEKLPRLNAKCDEVKDFGLDPSIAEAAGVGYANTGLMKGHIAIPLWINGAVVGFVGVPKGVWVKLPRNLTGLA
jgi:hypothetical protein